MVWSFIQALISYGVRRSSPWIITSIVTASPPSFQPQIHPTTRCPSIWNLVTAQCPLECSYSLPIRIWMLRIFWIPHRLYLWGAHFSEGRGHRAFLYFSPLLLSGHVFHFLTGIPSSAIVTIFPRLLFSGCSKSWWCAHTRSGIHNTFWYSSCPCIWVYLATLLCLLFLSL